MVDINVWINGLILGWFFHLIICSVILHKYVTHRTFKVSKFMHPILLYIATLNLNGSPLAWANLHRLHHSTSDQINDPHNPKIVGWVNSLFVMNLFNGDASASILNNLRYCRDLTSDKWHLFFHKYTQEVVFGTYIAVGMVNMHWLITLMIGTAVSFVGLFFTTYVYHFRIPLIQYRTHDTPDNSHNNLLSTLLFPGESYHNNHHNNPANYNTAEKWYEFDASSLIINIIRNRQK